MIKAFITHQRNFSQDTYKYGLQALAPGCCFNSQCQFNKRRLAKLSSRKSHRIPRSATDFRKRKCNSSTFLVIRSLCQKRTWPTHLWIRTQAPQQLLGRICQAPHLQIGWIQSLLQWKNVGLFHLLGQRGERRIGTPNHPEPNGQPR